jgi:hypothetical protein
MRLGDAAQNAYNEALIMWATDEGGLQDWLRSEIEFPLHTRPSSRQCGLGCSSTTQPRGVRGLRVSQARMARKASVRRPWHAAPVTERRAKGLGHDGRRS